MMERRRTLGFSAAVPGISPTYVLASQSTCGQRLTIADDVIVNDGEEAALDARIKALHARYLELARRLG
jgi:dephospho-CoA kinase